MSLIVQYEFSIEKQNSCKPAIDEISEAFGISTSVARYYLTRMAELRMGKQPKVYRAKTNTVICPSRSYILLPLDQADPAITSYLQLQKEK